MYNYRFSLQIVEEFRNAHPRGWAIIENNFETFTEERVVLSFMHDQRNWNIIKACVKMADRLSTSHVYSRNIPLIIENVLKFKEMLLTGEKQKLKLKEQRKTGVVCPP